MTSAFEEKEQIVTSDEARQLKEKLFEIFKAGDLNGDKLIDMEEFENVIIQFVPTMTNKQKIIGMFNALDENGDGDISFAEFLTDRNFNAFLELCGYFVLPETGSALNNNPQETGHFHADSNIYEQVFKKIQIESAILDDYKEKVSELNIWIENIGQPAVEKAQLLQLKLQEKEHHIKHFEHELLEIKDENTKLMVENQELQQDLVEISSHNELLKQQYSQLKHTTIHNEEYIDDHQQSYLKIKAQYDALLKNGKKNVNEISKLKELNDKYTIESNQLLQNAQERDEELHMYEENALQKQITIEHLEGLLADQHQNIAVLKAKAKNLQQENNQQNELSALPTVNEILSASHMRTKTLTILANQHRSLDSMIDFPVNAHIISTENSSMLEYAYSTPTFNSLANAVEDYTPSTVNEDEDGIPEPAEIMTRYSGVLQTPHVDFSVENGGYTPASVGSDDSDGFHRDLQHLRELEEELQSLKVVNKNITDKYTVLEGVMDGKMMEIENVEKTNIVLNEKLKQIQQEFDTLQEITNDEISDLLKVKTHLKNKESLTMDLSQMLTSEKLDIDRKYDVLDEKFCAMVDESEILMEENVVGKQNIVRLELEVKEKCSMIEDLQNSKQEMVDVYNECNDELSKLRVEVNQHILQNKELVGNIAKVNELVEKGNDICDDFEVENLELKNELENVILSKMELIRATSNAFNHYKLLVLNDKQFRKYV